jgi:hypothetical protein
MIVRGAIIIPSVSETPFVVDRVEINFADGACISFSTFLPFRNFQNSAIEMHSLVREELLFLIT